MPFFGRRIVDRRHGVAVVTRALEKTPEGRQTSALQLAEELQAVSGIGGNAFSRAVFANFRSCSGAY